MPPRILIIGIGSPLGDDRVGLVAAERLRMRLGARATIRSAERAGVHLIDLWAPTDRVILLDAVLTGARPGTVQRIPAERIASTRFPWSSHGIGLGETISLARVLNQLPARLVLLGVEIASPPHGMDLSPGIADAVPHLIQRVLEEIGAAHDAHAPTN